MTVYGCYYQNRNIGLILSASGRKQPSGRLTTTVAIRHPQRAYLYGSINPVISEADSLAALLIGLHRSRRRECATFRPSG